MNTRLLHVKVWVLLHRDSLLRIICCDVLKYLGLCEWVAFFVEASEPQPWCLCIEIICYAQVILSYLEDEATLLAAVIRYFLLFEFLFRKHAGTIIVVVIVYVVQVNDSACSALWYLLISTNNLHSTLTIIIEV